MKLLSIAIPCYNSEAYMEKCVDSLLAGGEDVEILIVNDGSSDRTAEIADSYEKKYSYHCKSDPPGKRRTRRGGKRRYPKCHRPLFQSG